MPKIEAINVGGTNAMVASESAFSTLVCAALIKPSVASCRIRKPRLQRLGDALQFADIARQRGKPRIVEPVACPW